MSTIVALSSGRPPAAIGVVRVSGPVAFAAATALVGPLPTPRRASLRVARDESGATLDRMLVIGFPATSSATGEDLVELHCHGGRATIDAVIRAVLRHGGVRRAEPGEFTRQALTNGRIDLAQAEGIADLVEAETEAQRRVALSASEGQVSRAIRGWMAGVAALSAQVEAVLDFIDEDDVARDTRLLSRARRDASTLRAEIEGVLAAPPVERVRDGLRVVIAGPPNSGKSTLLNLLSQSDAAIVSPIAGTTRDRIEVPVRRGDIAYRLTDTAGLRATVDPIEGIGVARANDAVDSADVLVWLGDDAPPRQKAIWVHARADLPERSAMPVGCDIAVRSDRAESVEYLWDVIAQRARALIPALDDIPLHEHQREACAMAAENLDLSADPVIAGEQLRLARRALARVLGIDATETMLDTLFSRFCIGK